MTHQRRAYLLTWSQGGSWESRPVNGVLDEAVRDANDLVDVGRASAVAVVDVEHEQVVYRYRAPDPGTVSVADQVFLVAHDEHTGRPRVHADVLGLALGAALLAELVFAERVDVVADGAVLLLSHEPPSSDPLAHRVFGLVRRDWRQGHRRDAGTWVKALAADARDQVGGRLVDAGTVTREAGRRMFRRSPVPVYPAASPEQAAYATTRLHAALHAYPMRAADVVLAALIRSVGLFSHLTYGCERAHPSDSQLTAALPTPLRTLLRRTRAAIAESTLSPR